jgi:predicted ATPase
MSETMRVVISGCSSGGKSTLVAELRRRGYAAFDEPGRTIVREEATRGGDALPWGNAEKFVHGCIALGLEQWDVAAAHEVAFFDRSLVDAFNALETMARPAPARFATVLHDRRYHRQVFMAPPWAEIYMTDNERKHGLGEAMAEFESLLRFYPRQGYETVMLPKIGVAERAAFVLATLGLAP